MDKVYILDIFGWGADYRASVYQNLNDARRELLTLYIEEVYPRLSDRVDTNGEIVTKEEEFRNDMRIFFEMNSIEGVGCITEVPFIAETKVELNLDEMLPF